MSRTMLINACRPEETRIAIADGDHLEDFHVEVADRTLTRGNIYRGVIANVQPSLNAAFIDYGQPRHGFLAIQDVVPEAWYGKPASPQRPRIEEVLQRGQPVVIQVTREAEAAKGAVVTTNLSLAGRYLVLTPFDSTRGVSRKVEDEEVRGKLKAVVKTLKVPDGCGVIVRTNALDQTKTALARDLAALLRLWKGIENSAREGRGTRLLYSDQDPILRALRDHLDAAVTEIVVDSDPAHQVAEQYLKAFMPRTKVALTRWQERAPLFARGNLEQQIERIYDRTVSLPGRGSISIDKTEALTAIDVNSGKSTGASRQEDTALATNLEAAEEIARQLRMRDLGGLVVVDFIDMKTSRHRLKVEKQLKEAMKPDRARFSVGRISPNGLLEINRQKISQAIEQRTHIQCPTCQGNGRIASPDTLALSLLRRIEERIAGGTIRKVRLGLNPEVANHFQNRRRADLARLEEEFQLEIEVYGVRRLHAADTEVEFLHRDTAPVLSNAPVVARQPLGIIAKVEKPAKSERPDDGGRGDRGRSRSESGRGQERPGRQDAPRRPATEPAEGFAARRGSAPASDPWADKEAARPEAAATAGQATNGAEAGSTGADGADDQAPRRRRRRRGGRNRRRRSGGGEAGQPTDAVATEGGADRGGSDDPATSHAIALYDDAEVEGRDADPRDFDFDLDADASEDSEQVPLFAPTTSDDESSEDESSDDESSEHAVVLAGPVGEEAPAPHPAPQSAPQSDSAVPGDPDAVAASAGLMESDDIDDASSERSGSGPSGKPTLATVPID